MTQINWWNSCLTSHYCQDFLWEMALMAAFLLSLKMYLKVYIYVHANLNLIQMQFSAVQCIAVQHPKTEWTISTIKPWQLAGIMVTCGLTVSNCMLTLKTTGSVHCHGRLPSTHSGTDHWSVNTYGGQHSSGAAWGKANILFRVLNTPTGSQAPYHPYSCTFL